VGFQDLANDDYRLASSSPFANATSDGHPLGADVAAINALVAP
jgi:hypothetical protein